MKPHCGTRLLTVLAALIFLPLHLPATDCKVNIISSIPLNHHTGVSGAFTGKIGNSVVIAGGSDFPDKKPWEGGKKAYYKDIYILDETEGKYYCILSETNLPVPLGNGCSASDGKTLFCFGGCNSTETSETVYAIRMADGTLQVDSVSRLPEGFIPTAAAIHKNEIYVHGVQQRKNVLYKFIPASGKWTRLAGCPDRIISEGASLVYQHNGKEEALYLIGGRGQDSDGLYISSAIWEYLPAHGSWNRKTDMTLDGKISPMMHQAAVPFGSAHIIVIGGDDGNEFIRRLKLEERIKTCTRESEKDSLKKELSRAYTDHKGFCNRIFAYHTITGTWTDITESEIPLPVAAGATLIRDKIIIPSGEIHPGIRSNRILEITLENHVTFGWVNYAVIIIYLLGMMGVGFYFSKKAKNTDQFFKGGSKIPWWAAGISIFATALSAITFLSIPAKAYMDDWGMFMFNMAILLIVPIVIKFYLPLFRKLNVASAYEYLEQRFSSPVRYLASLFFCLFMFARVAIVLFLPSLALNAVTGLNVYACILLMGGVTLAYCTMGGIEAVIWGDVIQGIILVGGALISLIYLIHGVDGGLNTIMNVAIEESKFNILDFTFDCTRPVFWVTLIGGIANQLLTYTSDQSVVQRYITVKDTSGIKKGLWLNGILSVPIALIFFSIGTGLYVFFKQNPEMLNIGMNNTDSILPHYIMCSLPTGIAGLLIAAIFAAAMSTLSANINSTSTVMTEDFYTRFKKEATDSGKMNFARWTGIAIGTFGIGMAVILATFDIASLWDQFNFFLGLLTSGLGGLFMMGISTKRIGTKSALTGFACSIVILLLCNQYSHVSVILYGFIGLISCFLAGYLSSFIFGYGR